MHRALALCLLSLAASGCVAATDGGRNDEPRPRVATDLVLVEAVDPSAVSDLASYRNNVALLLDRLTLHGPALGLRVALVFSGENLDPTRIDSLLNALGPSEVLTVNFRIPPSAGPLAAIVTGCGPEFSVFPDFHAGAGTPIVCGRSLTEISPGVTAELTHAWLWELEPVRGVLQGFLRPNARRVYAFISSGDEAFLPPDAFQTLVDAQPQAPPPRVISFAPLSAGVGLCLTTAQSGTRYSTLAAAFLGSSQDFCVQDWSSHAESLLGALQQAHQP